MPAGHFKGDPLKRARDEIRKFVAYKPVSPETAVIIARAGNDEPKPIIIQKRVKGQPICETPIRELFQESVLVDLRNIIKTMRNVYQEERAYDLCGQHFSGRLLRGFLGIIPFFSDNIVVSEGRAFLVDNAAQSISEDVQRNKIKQATVLTRLFLSELVVDLSLFIQKAHGSCSKIRKFLRQPTREGKALEIVK